MITLAIGAYVAGAVATFVWATLRVAPTLEDTGWPRHLLSLEIASVWPLWWAIDAYVRRE